MIKRITEQRLYNITLYYLTRYEASVAKVRAMLRRRLQKARLNGAEVPAEAPEWIEQVIRKVQSLGYVDDSRFAENQVRLLAGQGKSARFIVGKLQQAGIAPEVVQDLLNQQEGDEESRARCWARKKRIGPYRGANRADYRQKDMAALARAGFSYETVCAVLGADSDDQ